MWTRWSKNSITASAEKASRAYGLGQTPAGTDRGRRHHHLSGAAHLRGRRIDRAVPRHRPLHHPQRRTAGQCADQCAAQCVGECGPADSVHHSARGTRCGHPGSGRDDDRYGCRCLRHDRGGILRYRSHSGTESGHGGSGRHRGGQGGRRRAAADHSDTADPGSVGALGARLHLRGDGHRRYVRHGGHGRRRRAR